MTAEDALKIAMRFIRESDISFYGVERVFFVPAIKDGSLVIGESWVVHFTATDSALDDSGTLSCGTTIIVSVDPTTCEPSFLATL
jgi:hypothetical protein